MLYKCNKKNCKVSLTHCMSRCDDHKIWAVSYIISISYFCYQNEHVPIIIIIIRNQGALNRSQIFKYRSLRARMSSSRVKFVEQEQDVFIFNHSLRRMTRARALTEQKKLLTRAIINIPPRRVNALTHLLLFCAWMF